METQTDPQSTSTSGVQFSVEEVEAVLSTERDDEDTPFEMKLGELKQIIRSGQLEDEDLDSLSEKGCLSIREIQILRANPIEEDEEEPPTKPTAPKSDSVTVKTQNAIRELLERSTTALTIDEICVELGVLTVDADPNEEETRKIKKKFRALTRRVIANHEEGDREQSLGRNRLYAIGEVEHREDSSTENPDDGDSSEDDES